MKTVTWRINLDRNLGVAPITGSFEVANKTTHKEITRRLHQECDAAMIAQGLDPNNWDGRGWSWS